MKKDSKKKVASDKSRIVAQLPEACQNETSAVEFMEAQRWGDTPRCPHCGDVNVYQMRDRATGQRNKRYLWRCRDCKQQYTVRIGTVFEESRIPLRHWCYAFWAACASKKGVSALQIKRMTGLSYKSALFMMHRIRYAMASDHSVPPKLEGTVEVDETYVGGKPRYKSKKNWKFSGRATPKPPVVAIVQRGGDVRACHMPTINGKNLREQIRKNVQITSRIVTDDASVYCDLDREYLGGHSRINHSSGVYVVGDTHTNTVEGFFSLLKRGVYGTFHSISEKHLHRYVSEFEFRYNTRSIDDGARTAAAIRGAEGKRLHYREPLTGAAS